MFLPEERTYPSCRLPWLSSIGPLLHGALGLSVFKSSLFKTPVAAVAAVAVVVDRILHSLKESCLAANQGKGVGLVWVLPICALWNPSPMSMKKGFQVKQVWETVNSCPLPRRGVQDPEDSGNQLRFV